MPQTGQEPDFIDVNTNLQIFHDLEEIFCINPRMRERISSDFHVNNYGRNFLNLCKAYEL